MRTPPRAAQFIAQIAADAKTCATQRCEMSAKDKRDRRIDARDKRVVLTMDDLAAAMKDYGMNAKKPPYFAGGVALAAAAAAAADARGGGGGGERTVCGKKLPPSPTRDGGDGDGGDGRGDGGEGTASKRPRRSRR